MVHAAAVSSVISPDYLEQLVKEKYALPNPITCKIIRVGINHTYLVQAQEQQYILRIYSYQWRSEKEVLAEMELLLLLKEKKVSVSYPIPDKGDEYIQKINAVEGVRLVVLFSYAKGETIKNPSKAICFNLGVEMAKMHQITIHHQLARKPYNADTLVNWALQAVKQHFSEPLEEIAYITRAYQKIAFQFKEAAVPQLRYGSIHLDIWSDNIRIQEDGQITLFDFDNCGNGWLFLDIAYTLMLLFREAPDAANFEEKAAHFFSGYETITSITKEEKRLLPYGGLAIWLHYTGVHVQRFNDFSNLFFNAAFLKAWIQLGDKWMKYNEIEI